MNMMAGALEATMGHEATFANGSYTPKTTELREKPKPLMAFFFF